MDDLARRTATATGRAELARMLEEHLREILHPRSLLVYLQRTDGRLAAMAGAVPDGLATIPEGIPALGDLARRGQCWVAPAGSTTDEIGRSPLGALEPQCLVPVTDRQGDLVGVFVLGPRLSAEPYSDEDTRLLLSAAEHSGIALEVIRLAEQLAERMDAERRVDREIAIAREVQGRLFPQNVPQLRSLELAARCIQARSVGGDYFDFLELGPEQIGLVLADVSGKGVHAALRMANLQAHLRSQAGSSPRDPLRVLRQVNRMLWASTHPGDFATLFLGIYADASRRLTYINCGHNPPLCLRSDGTVEWLGATATVLGAFEEWECALGRTQFAAGDLLVAYSDGVTEAVRGGEPFGEGRLIEVLQSRPDASPDSIVSAILDRVQGYSAGDQHDDLTLLVARAR